ncbi:protein CBFA2T2-like isoform X2 [Brienomyrus brachyistius]|nr:protein CBFA2T2-like isoform X2 [Brienomyrus brachyistius]XP_048873986.1 protein CBFA2T2-like isoform X2 [Brienomyrus brachyistius]
MPGSPVEVKVLTLSGPSAMPSLLSVKLSEPRSASFSSTPLSNGMNHSPPILTSTPSWPQRYSNGPPSLSSALANQQLPPSCGARQLSKLKRFLTTLQQFANDISPEIGENVRSLVLALVNSTVTIEEFHSRLQEATNFPLRPFVIPFLKANLPLLQRELLRCSHATKQTPAQHLSQPEHLHRSTSLTASPDSSELLKEPNEAPKRHSPVRTKENGFHECPSGHLEPPAKRVCTISPAPRHSPILALGQLHPIPPPLQHHTLEDISAPRLCQEPQHPLELRELKDRPRHQGTDGGYCEVPVDHRLTDREWTDEWRHLDHGLNGIVDMVEKTRRSINVLQRCQKSDCNELHYWRRHSSEQEEARKGGPALGKSHSSHGGEGITVMTQRDFSSQPSSGCVPDEIWRKTEEAVNGVKRHALDEVQKAVAVAEQRAFEMIAVERAKMEKTLAEAKQQATKDAIQVISEQEDSSENCWNCGRKASETCSGCNAARYCGSFCQHKDWERHHLICSPGLQAQPKALSTVTVNMVPDVVSSPDTENGGSRTSTPTTVPAAESNGH